jgi:hypothetical protein
VRVGVARGRHVLLDAVGRLNMETCSRCDKSLTECLCVPLRGAVLRVARSRRPEHRDANERRIVAEDDARLASLKATCGTVADIKTMLGVWSRFVRRFEVINDRPDRIVVVVSEVVALNVSFSEAMEETREGLRDRLEAGVQLDVTYGATWRSRFGFMIPLTMMTRERLELLMMYVEQRTIDASDDDQQAHALGYEPKALVEFWGEWGRIVHVEVARRLVHGDPQDPVLDPAEAPIARPISRPDAMPPIVVNRHTLDVKPPWQHVRLTESNEDERPCRRDIDPCTELAATGACRHHPPVAG